MQKVLTILAILFLSLGAVADDGKQAKTKSWTADNGNGTFTNPLFYDVSGTTITSQAPRCTPCRDWCYCILRTW